MSMDRIKTWTRRRLAGRPAAALSALAAALALAPAPVAAQAYPDRPVRVLIGWPAGGTPDVITRIVTEDMGNLLGQRVVVENRPGASSNIAAAAAARAPADGYTLFVATVATQGIAPALFRNLNFDPKADFAAISRWATLPAMVVVKADSPFRTMQDLLAAARREPRRVMFGTAGNGTSLHLSGQLLQMRTGVQLEHAPYRGGAMALNDVVAGRLPVAINNLPEVVGQLQAGAIRGLAVTTRRRSPLFPDVPTMEEAGVPDFETGSWVGLVAPHDTPQPVVEALARASDRALAQPAVAARLREAGATPAPLGPAEFGQFVEGELEKWAPIVRATGMQIE